MMSTIRRLFNVCLVAVLGMLPAAAVQAAQSVPLSELRQNSHFHGIAVDPDDGSRLWLATHHGFFVVTPDGLATRLSRDQNDYMGFTPHPTDASVLYASGHPQSGGNMGFIASSDGGRTWSQLSPGNAGPVDFHQMDVSRADPATIYGAYHGWLQFSRDGGNTWQPGPSLPAGLLDLAASAKDVKRLYAATKEGLIDSVDGGESWKPAHVNRSPATMVQTTGDGTVYAFVISLGLLRTEEPSPNWEPVSNGFGDRYLLHLAVDPREGRNLYAITHKGEVLVSKDGGATWSELGAP